MEPDLTRFAAIKGLKTGLIAGAVSVYVAAIGLVGRFDAREFITDVLSLGYLLYIVIALAAGYLVARAWPTPEGPVALPTPLRVGAGTIAGAVSGIVMTPFLFLIDSFTVRDTFVAIGQRLVDVLTFEKSPGSAAVIYIVGGAAIATLGAAMHLVAPRYRRVLLTGVATLVFISLMEPLIRVMLDDFNKELWPKLNLDISSDWLYESEGVTLFPGAVVCVLLGALASFFRGRQRERTARLAQAGEEAPVRTQRVKIALAVLLIAFLAYLPQIVGRFPSEIIGVVGIYVLLGLGLNIVVGYAGMLDLGYVAFYAIGAYSMGVLTSPASPKFSPELTFWTALPIVILITTISGLLIGAPVLRLRGDYLAIVTLGFGEIIRVIVLSDWAAPLLGGAQGLLRVPAPSLFGNDLRDPDKIYYLILACVLLVVFVAWRVKHSRIGRAWNAMREDESVAEAMGISIIKTKLLAFGLGAALASFGGAIFAGKIGSLHPNTFLLIVSINVLAIIVLGGMGSIPGVVIGAFVLVGIPEVLREFGEFRLLFYGAILMALMILKPEGLLPDVRRAEELHEAKAREALVVTAPAVAGGGDAT